MPEYIGRSGTGRVQVDSIACTEKLYTLLALFFASKPISELCGDDISCPIRPILDEHEERLITHLLIECAVLIRALDDQYYERFGRRPEKDTVGVLREPSDSNSGNALTLREGCNKIIHAKTLNFDLERQNDWYSRYLNPVVHLYGERNGASWKAELKSVDWVRSASRLARCFD